MTASVTAARLVACRLAQHRDALTAHYAIRRAVFVAEQGLFAGSDADARDAHPATLHVLGLVAGHPAGAVRLFPLDPADPAGDWQGDRLAVLPEFRSAGLGKPLVQFAVTTAGARGGASMIAHVQPRNHIFFRRMGWRDDGEPEIYVGHRHLPMRIALGPARP